MSCGRWHPNEDLEPRSDNGMWTEPDRRKEVKSIPWETQKLPFKRGDRVTTPDGAGTVSEDILAVWVKMDCDKVLHPFHRGQVEFEAKPLPPAIRGDEPINDQQESSLHTSDTKDTNPKDRAATTRLDFSVWPETASAYGALAMTEGDYKYGAYNYRVAGVQASVYVSALRRHMAKWYNGEWYDPKTGVPHLANAIACIGVLIDAHECGALIDDRPPKMDMTRLLTEFEVMVKRLQEVFPPSKGPGKFTEIKHGKVADTTGS